MSRAKNPGVADVQIGHAFGNSLFERLQVSKLRHLFEQLFPHKKITQRGATALLMNCVDPKHEDRKPSFYVFPNINYCVCKSCGFRTNNLLELLRVSLGFSYTESLLKIHEITGVRVANDKVAKQLDKLDIHQQSTRFFGEICNQHLINLISYHLHKNPVEVDDRPFYTDALVVTLRPVLDWLFSQRHLDPDKVAYLPYGVMPSEALFQALAKRVVESTWENKLRAGVTASAYTKERRLAVLNRLTEMHREVPAEHLHAVTFHTGYSTNTPGRIRSRRVTRDGGTDNNFWMLPGFTDRDPVGYLGLYSPDTSGLRRVDPESTRVIVVESEMSMLAAQEKVIEHSVPDLIFVASAGSNNDTDMLHSAGFHAADLLMDHPDPAFGRGEEQIKIRLMSALYLQTRVFVGWEGFRGDILTVKDPDDALQHHGWEHFRRYLVDEAAKHFVPSDAWASERAIEEGLTVLENNILGRQQKVVEFGACVRHPALLSAFVTRVSAALNIPQGPLRAAIVKVKDDEAGFIARIVETIKSDFSILYKDEMKPGVLMLFHKRERRYVAVNTNEGTSIMTALSNVYGEMYTFFVDHIGLPGRKEGEEHVPTAASIRDGQKYIADYLKIAFQSIYQGVLTQDECIPVNTGLHFEIHPDDPEMSISRLHVGDRWYRLTNDLRTDLVAAVELEGPIDGAHLFLPNQRSWSRDIRGVEDILQANEITGAQLQEHYLRLCELIDAGWKFRHQKQDVAYLAALIFVYACGDAFDIKSITRINGESNSGKSTAAGMFGEGQYPWLQIVQQSSYGTGYTQASTYLEFNRSTLAAILEEATQDPSMPNHKSKQLEDMNEMFRQAIFEGGAKIKRFGPTGKLIQYVVRMPIMMTSVQEPRDQQEANRSYIVETVKDDARRDPQITIRKMLKDPHELERISREIQIGMLRFLPRLRRYQDEIYRTLNEKQLASFQAPTRFLRNFAPIGSVLQTIGIPWEPVVTEMIESRKSRLLSEAASSNSSIVYDKILRAPVVPVPNARNSFLSVMQCATMSGGYEMLNAAGIGVTLNPNNWTLIVDFVAATSPGGAMYRMNDLNKYTPHQLKALIDHHPDIVRPHRYKEYGVMEALAANNIMALEHEISVLKIGRIRDHVMTRAASYTGIAMTAVKSDSDPTSSESSGSANNL